MATQRCFVLLSLVTSVLLLGCLALAGLLVWRVYFLEDAKPAEDAPLTNVTLIKLKYPGYFRTPEDQQDYVQMMTSSVPVRQPVLNVSRVHTRCFYNLYCEKGNTTTTTISPYRTSTVSSYSPLPTRGSITPNNTQAQPRGRRKRQSDTSLPCDLDSVSERKLTYHGCCVSYSEFTHPSTLPTAQPGQSGNVNIAQFPSLNQYFQVQHCCQAGGCTGCQCSQTFYAVTAVVTRGGQLRVEFVMVPGCCQCMNAILAT